jgi:hypothetical protein
VVGVLQQMIEVAAGDLAAAGLADALRKTQITAEGTAVKLAGTLPGSRILGFVEGVLAP